jgi:hypothetical protein
MPKIKLSPLLPEDVPIWNALLAELGDPRPYAPVVTEFTVVDVPTEPYEDAARDEDDGLSALDDAVEDVERSTMDRLSEGHAALDELIDEFRTRHGIVVADGTTRVLDRLTTVVDATTVLPIVGTLSQTDDLPRTT